MLRRAIVWLTQKKCRMVFGGWRSLSDVLYREGRWVQGLHTNETRELIALDEWIVLGDLLLMHLHNIHGVWDIHAMQGHDQVEFVLMVRRAMEDPGLWSRCGPPPPEVPAKEHRAPRVLRVARELQAPLQQGVDSQAPQHPAPPLESVQQVALAKGTVRMDEAPLSCPPLVPLHAAVARQTRACANTPSVFAEQQLLRDNLI